MVLNNLLRSIIGLLLFFNNKIFNKVIHKILNILKPTQIKTKNGFYIFYKKTGIHPTSIRKTVITGTYESSTMKMIKKLVKPGSCAVDVGAHEGYVSLFLSKLVGQNGKVFSIEPNPENIEYIKKNLECNPAYNIKIIEKAAGNNKTNLHFHFNPDGGAWGSLIHFSHFKTEKMVEVEVDTLDNIFKDVPYKIDFLKVDTEGNELNVFWGAEKILSEHKPIIVFEVSLTFWAHLNCSVDILFNIFRDHGYKLFIVRNDKLKEFEWLDERIINMFAIPFNKCRQIGITK